MIVENGSLSVSTGGSYAQNNSEHLDDDGRIKRTGTTWTASAHIITAVIGSGVLSLAWAVAQLGWIAGPAVMLVFSFVTYYTSILLAYCYRTGDPVTGKRNYTYMDVVQSNFGSLKVNICGVLQYLNLFGSGISYTIASAVSMMALERSSCFQKSGGKDPCVRNSNPYMIGFGIVQILFSQIPDFDQLWWLSSVAAVMSFLYSTIALGLGIAKVVENGKIKGSLTGISVAAHITQSQKIWRIFQALGDIAFAYSFSFVLVEIQDTVKSPPTESKTMKKATLISIIVTTTFYMLCGCFGYASYGDLSPSNILTDLGFFKPYWVLDIANVALVIHLVGSFQVFAQPLYAAVEKLASKRYPNNKVITNDIEIPFLPFKLNLFRLVWRTVFVVITTIISMLLPFFNDIVGLLGALGFWPLTVYFPVEMYINQKRVPKWSREWVCLQVMSMVCLLVTIVSTVGSIVGIVLDLQSYKPFTTELFGQNPFFVLMFMFVFSTKCISNINRKLNEDTKTNGELRLMKFGTNLMPLDNVYS